MNTQTDAYYPGYEIDPEISSYWEPPGDRIYRPPRATSL